MSEKKRLVVVVMEFVLLLLSSCRSRVVSTPDRIATGVAEAKAVAATLTSEAPTISGKTQVPTKTPYPKSPTVPSTRTPVPPTPTLEISKTIDQYGGIKFVKKTTPYGRCEALAPADWAIIGDDETGMSAGLSDPQLTMFVGWLVPWTIYSLSPQDRNEDYFLRFSLCMGNLSDRYGSGWLVPCREDYANVDLDSNVTPLPNGYFMRGYRTRNNAIQKDIEGVVIYKNFSSGDIGLYLLRMAATIPSIWEEKGGLAVSSAISLRCTCTLGSRQSWETTTQKTDPDVTLSDKWEEAIMGYENVYSPTTGEHWEAPLNSYWATGPQGGGYYRSLPDGGYERLERGYGEY